MTDAIRAWVEEQSGLTSIWMHGNAPRPGKPYCSLQVVSSVGIAQPYIEAPDSESGEARVASQREVVVSVAIYESKKESDPRAAFSRVEALRDSLDLPSVLMKLKSGGWFLRAVELLADAPVVRETEWEPRAIFDVRFGTTVEQLDEIGVVEEIQGTAVLSGKDYEIKEGVNNG